MYIVSSKESYFNLFFDVLVKLIDPVYWVLYGPFLEVFIGIFKCSDGYHKIVRSVSCYSGIHITLIVFCMFFSLLLIFLVIFCNLFHTETNPVKENVLSKIDEKSELPIIVFRILVIIYIIFIQNVIQI